MTQRIENTTGKMAKGDSPIFQYTLRMLMLYFVLTFVITWGILIPTLSVVSEDRQLLLIIFSAFGPFLAAVITIWTGKGRTALHQWLRQVFRQFSWLGVGSGKLVLSRPAHQRVTLTVGRSRKLVKPL